MHRWLKRLLNTILPPRCTSCHALVEDAGMVCADCWRELEFIASPLCKKCGFPFPYAMEEEALCGTCASEEPRFTLARAALRYNDKSAALISHFKYADRTYAAPLFAKWMTQAGADCLKDAELLVPVPLHPRRLFARRYNQAALLVQQIGKLTGKPIALQALVRRKHNPPQVSLSQIQRRQNVKNIFSAHPNYGKHMAGKHVVLIDDVMTTGATIIECTKAISRAGAASVRVLTLARTAERG